MHCSSSLTRTASTKPEDGIYVVAPAARQDINCTAALKEFDYLHPANKSTAAVRSATFFSLLNSCAGLLVSCLLGAACRCAALCSCP